MLLHSANYLAAKRLEPLTDLKQIFENFHRVPVCAEWPKNLIRFNLIFNL